MAHRPSRSPALSLLPMLSCIGLAVGLGAAPLPARAAIEDCFTNVPVPPKPRPSVRKRPAPAAAPATRVLADPGGQAPGAKASTGAAPARPVAKAPQKPATRAVARTAAAPAGSAASSRAAGQPSRPVARAPVRPGSGTAPAAAAMRKLPIECMPTPVRELQTGPIAPDGAPRASVVRQGPSLIEAAMPDAPLLVGILSGLRGDAAWVVAADTAEAGPDTPAIAVVGPWGSTSSVVAWGGGSGGGGGMGGGAYGPGPFGAGGPMSGFGGTGSPATRIKPAPTGPGEAVQDLVVPLGTPGSLAGVGDHPGVQQAAVAGPFLAPGSPGGAPLGDPDAGGDRPQPGLGDPPVSPPGWHTGDPPADTAGLTVTTAAVPVPGSVWLLALGAAVLLLFGSRRRQAAKIRS
jgi:hypothetical protein